MTEARYVGALALLGVGIVHLQQDIADSYSSIPTIGTLFVLNFAAATALAVGLVVPLRAAVMRPYAPVIRPLLALGGIATAAGSLTALLLSENGGVFGFSEHGYRFAIVLSIVFEVLAMAALAAFLATSERRSVRPRSAPRPIPKGGGDLIA